MEVHCSFLLNSRSGHHILNFWLTRVVGRENRDARTSLEGPDPGLLGDLDIVDAISSDNEVLVGVGDTVDHDGQGDAR
jgi:hypothetical protein